MKTAFITIGNSQGVILPAIFLKQLKLANRSTVEHEVSNGNVVIEPESRQGWAEAAKMMNTAGDEDLFLPDVPNEFEHEQWTW